MEVLFFMNYLNGAFNIARKSKMIINSLVLLMKVVRGTRLKYAGSIIKKETYLARFLTRSRKFLCLLKEWQSLMNLKKQKAQLIIKNSEK